MAETKQEQEWKQGYSEAEGELLRQIGHMSHAANTALNAPDSGYGDFWKGFKAYLDTVIKSI